MAKEGDIPKDDLEFMLKVFTAPKKPLSTEKPKIEKPREQCPYCGKEFANISKHAKICAKNPNRLEKAEPAATVQPQIEIPGVTSTKRKVVYMEEEIQKPDWSSLIVESVQTLRNLSEYLKEIKERGVKIQIAK